MVLTRKFRRMLAVLTVASISGLAGLANLAPVQARYVQYDSNNDGYLERGEYIDYSFRLIDLNRDGYINANEWNDYIKIWYAPFDVFYDDTFNLRYFDINDDGYLDYSEYKYAYDINIFEAWDGDKDGVIEKHEYDKVASVYADYDLERLYKW